MFLLKNEIQFDSAHFLEGHEGKCSNIHGHRYKLVVMVKGNKLAENGSSRGMVEDFSFIKAILKDVHTMFDHKLILEDTEKGRMLAEALYKIDQSFAYMMVPYRPTAEEMSRHIFNILRNKGLAVDEVELFETPSNSCKYREE